MCSYLMLIVDFFFFFSSRRRHTRLVSDWSSDVCSSDLKRALRGRLPPEHLRAPKRGFVGPTAEWLRHELRDVIEDELAASRVRRLGYFDPAVVRGLLDDHFARRHNREGILWALLCFSIWHRVYLESPAAVASHCQGLPT